MPGRVISLRCSEEESERWRAAAGANDRTLSDHVRHLLDANGGRLTDGEMLILAETRRTNELLLRLWSSGVEETMTPAVVQAIRREVEGISQQTLVAMVRRSLCGK